MERLSNMLQKARFIWVCGNGGSAATAEHFATDLVKKGYKAIALSGNTSLMTMLANDYGYDEIFSRQLQVYAQANDLLITISCSGTSANIVKAQETAVTIGMKVYSFETFTTDKNYQVLEDKHLQFAHKVLDFL